MTQEEELIHLREQVQAYQQRELEALKDRLKQAEIAADHYRNECLRLDKVARDMDATYQQELYRLRSELDSLRNSQTTIRRPQMPANTNGHAR